MSRYVLGVHSGHDSSACLIKDNKIIYAIEKERLSRKKHDSGDPVECIDYLMDAANITPAQINLVVRSDWYDSTELKDSYYEQFTNVKKRYEHHLFHAYAVSLMRQTGDMLAYIVDGRGCRPKDNNEAAADEDLFEAESVYFFHNNKIRCLQEEKRYAKHFSGKYKWGSHMDSAGYAYADVSRLIFRDYNAAGKIMALAAYGKHNQSIPKVFCYDDDFMRVNTEWLDFLNRFNIPLPYESQIAKDIAYSLQKEVEEYLGHRIEHLAHTYHCRHIGLSGGVALNCKNNGVLMNQHSIDTLDIFPACGDNGIAIGAAVWGIRELYHDYGTISWEYGLGKKYIEFIYDSDSIDQAVDLLHSDIVIGLYENGSEFGPRALCNRSILASAKNESMKHYLNRTVKQRELFRPFGGVVLERNVHLLTSDKIASDYMLSAVQIKSEIKNKMPALIHADGTVRIQIIREKNKNTAIWHILDVIEKKYGEIVLLNTSFNGKGEPIAETIEEARNTAIKNGIEFLFAGGKIERLPKCT